MQKRSRDCSVEGQCAKYGPSIESRPCNMEVCPSKAEWGEWEALSPCTVSCGGGFRTTKRQCINGAIGSEGCSVDEYLKIQSCGTVKLFVTLNWVCLTNLFFQKRMPVNNGPSGPDARQTVVGDQRVATAAIKSKIWTVGVESVLMLAFGVTGLSLLSPVLKV